MTARQASGWQATIPPLSEWQAAYPPLRRAGAELNGPCPLCAGVDRFHVREKGGRVMVGCRGCMDGQPEAVRGRRFGQVLQAVFGDGRATPPGQPGRPLVSTHRRPPRKRTTSRGSWIM